MDEVERELLETRAAIGSGADVRSFVEHALRAEGAIVSGGDVVMFDLAETPRAARPACPRRGDDASRRLRAPVKDGVTYLSRTPLVDGLASYVVDTALDPQLAGNAKRAGATRTRLRPVRPSPRPAALRRRHAERGGRATADRRGDQLLASRELPSGGLAHRPGRGRARRRETRRQRHLRARRRLRPNGGRWSRSARQHLAEIAAQRAEALLDAHRRVRRGSEGGRRSTRSSRSSRSTCSGFTSSSLSWTRSR